jgi:hypothetical protein
MSKISLAPDASGSGIFTIASPNSNTNHTLTLPDDTGTIVTDSGNQAGSFTTLNTSGQVVFNDAGADVDFRVEGDTDANLLFVDASTDRVGVKTNAPSSDLHINPATEDIFTNGLRVQRADTPTQNVVFNYSGGSANIVATDAALSSPAIRFLTSTDGTTSTERMRIDSSGNVGIGTSSPAAKLQAVIGSGASVGVKYLNAGGSGLQFYTDSTVSNADTFIESPLTGVAMIFKNGGTERARITSGGALLIGATTLAGTGAFQADHPVGDQNIATFRNTAASSPYGNVISFTGASPDNNTNYFLLCNDSTATRTVIYSDGDVWTSDAGTLSSDQKLKNTITDASPKLDDVMRLRVRNFYWNEDYHPEKTDKKLIGFIAQEFEEVFPGLVTNGVIRGGNPIYEDQAVVDEEGNPVLDEDGNPKTEQVQIGETEKEYAKGIKEGKLIPILVKALQEAVERIETLEASNTALEARIAALETGA